MTTKTFNLNVKELVINAMPNLSISIVQATVQRELAMLFAEHKGAILPLFTVNNINLAMCANDSALMVGKALAQAIYQEIKQDVE